MRTYVVTLTENDEESVVGRYDTLAEAQEHIENITYYPPHCRFLVSLCLDDNGWGASGQDEDGIFEYRIEEVIV